jgi:AmiR/NasT family two-component response regulator
MPIVDALATHNVLRKWSGVAQRFCRMQRLVRELQDRSIQLNAVMARCKSILMKLIFIWV